MKTIKGWFFSCTHRGTETQNVVYCGKTKREAADWARNIRRDGDRTGPLVRIEVPAPNSRIKK